MSTERIDGSGTTGQIEPLTIDNAAVSASAGIASTKLASYSADRNAGGFKITNLAVGTAPSDAVNFSQLTAIQNGITYKLPVRLASTGNVSVTYTAAGGASARGQITGAPDTLDSTPLVANDRILLKDQTNGAQNGIWVVTTLGTGANGVWDRAADFDQDAEVLAGTQVPVNEGATYADTFWVLATNNPIIIGGGSGTVQTWIANSAILAGGGLLQSGNTFDVVAGDASLLVNANNMVVQKSGTTLATDGSGLKVADGGIGPTQITAGLAGSGLNGGAGTALSVDYKQDIFTGDNSTTVFALTSSPISNKATVSAKGLVQIPGTDYTISGTTLTFTTAPKNGWHVQVSYIAI